MPSITLEKQVEWISASRFHPVNLMLGAVAVDVAALLAGISPEIFIVIGPFNTIYSVFVHANLNWRLGWLQICAGQPGVSPLASCQRRARREFRQHLSGLGSDVRHILYARGRAAGRLWHRR